MPFGRKRAVARSATPRLQDVLGQEFCLTVAELQGITNAGELRKCAAKLGIRIHEQNSVSRSIMSIKASIINQYKRKLFAAARVRVQELESITCITKLRKRACQLGTQSRYGGTKEQRYVRKKVIIEEYKKTLSALHLWPASGLATSESSVFARNNGLSNYGFVVRSGRPHNVEDTAAPARQKRLFRYGFSVRSGPCHHPEEAAVPVGVPSAKRRR